MFSTLTDARASGYVEARRWHHDYRGFRLYAEDASGPRARGERFRLAVAAFPDPEWHPETHAGISYNPPGFDSSSLSRQTFGKSEPVKIAQELNGLNQLGAFVEMLSPATISAGVDVFLAQVEQFYRANPAAAAWEARREEIEQRPGERLARIGESLYGPRWQSDLARDLGVADRTVRAWVAGERRPAVGVWADLARIMHERRERLSALLDDLS